LRTLEKRDAAQARRVMRAHVQDSGRFVIAWLENKMSNAAT
jgi:DNA-binding GntR family transcriptional regulator